MKWFTLFTNLLPIFEAIYKSIEDAIRGGKSPTDVHQAVVDHAAELPAKIQAV